MRALNLFSQRISYFDRACGPVDHLHTWSELLAPLVNMTKEGCENKSALLILLIFYFKKSQKSNLLLGNKNLKCGEKSL